MRRSARADGVSVHAIAGAQSVLLAMNASNEARRDLVGFAIGRRQGQNGDIRWLDGFKFFRDLVPNPQPGEVRSTLEHPVQSFLWGHYTADPSRTYEYVVRPLYRPGNGDLANLRPGTDVEVRVRTEPLDQGTHAIGSPENKIEHPQLIRLLGRVRSGLFPDGGAALGRCDISRGHGSRSALLEMTRTQIPARSTPARKLRDIPRGVWALGFVSMFMDISSEMIHALLPLYLVGVLGASALTVGFIEGIAEATAMIAKIFSGALSDWLGKRKMLAAVGYGLAAFTKPVFPLATTVGWLVAARFVDRIGKGIRGAPRDALVADLSPEHVRGASFGLRQSLDTVGAFIGPLAAIGLMIVTANSYTTVFWIAVIPAFIAFGLLLIGVEEPAKHVDVVPKPRLRFGDAKRVTASFWGAVAISSVLTLARFSEAFLVLRAQNVGLPIALAPVIMVLMNLVYALASYPAGALSDRAGRRGVLVVGIAALVVADLFLGLGTNVSLMLLGVAFWGLHMALTQGLLAALVADTAPVELRGTAFGIFNFAGGIAMLIGSLTAGALWDAYGPTATFLAGAAFSGMALLGIPLLGSRAMTARV